MSNDEETVDEGVDLSEPAARAINALEFALGTNFVNIISGAARYGVQPDEIANVSVIAGASFAANAVANAVMQVDEQRMPRNEALALMREAFLRHMDERLAEVLPGLEAAAAFADATHEGTETRQ